jgi:zona occludens toxin (predicted ATPase)
MIEGYIGRPGSGKSYTLTERAMAQARRGREVFANYNIEGCWQFSPDQLLDLPPGLIVIDEAHLWFPSRMALKLPPSWLAMLSQTRKNGWDLMWASQHEARVDRVLRDVSSWMWLCQAWFGWNGHPVLFTAESYEPEFFRKPSRKMTKTYRVFSMNVARGYDTYERLTVASHAQSDTDAYAPGGAKKKPSRAAGGRTASVLDGVLPS